MSDESEVQKEMTEFYRRTLDRLPVIPAAKPFEVTTDIQMVPSVPFKPDAEVPIMDDDVKSVGGPPPPGITSVSPNTVSNAGGTTVTIIGKDFVNGSTVKIAGISATSVVFVNATTLTCVTPADGLGWMTVEVTNPSGQVATLNNAIYYANWPDNVLIEGFPVQRSDVYSGYEYPYKLTVRIGTQPFNIPAGVSIYTGLVTGHSTILHYPSLGYQNLENAFITEVGSAVLNSSTGPTANFTIKANSSPAHVNGYVDVGAVLGHGSETGQLPLYPTYGDSSHQPTAFRILMDVNGPYPPTVPSADYFSWDRGPGNTKLNAFSWLSGDHNSLSVTRRLSTGAVNTGFSGTATVTWVRIGSGVGELGVGGYTTPIHFTSGVSNIDVVANYTYTDVAGSQSFGYFRVTATDGTIVGSTPTCAVLNHL